jgi:hypothetical protein
MIEIDQPDSRNWSLLLRHLEYSRDRVETVQDSVLTLHYLGTTHTNKIMGLQPATMNTAQVIYEKGPKPAETKTKTTARLLRLMTTGSSGEIKDRVSRSRVPFNRSNRVSLERRNDDAGGGKIDEGRASRDGR